MTNIFTSTIKSILSGAMNQRLLIVLVVMFGAYSFFIARAVVAINERKSLYSDIRAEQAKVADLEIRYFALASEIDQAKVAELGFVDSQVPTFAYTNPATETVALVR